MQFPLALHKSDVACFIKLVDFILVNGLQYKTQS